MRDMHCHILPGVDDGARDLDESLAMLEAAKQAGVKRIRIHDIRHSHVSLQLF